MEDILSSSGAKSCGVCGDLAKSFHFGGLSCDSCKAFFRRSVQKDNYQKFSCCHKVPCIITIVTRKNCQYCRIQRCFAIGMEKSWVMSDMERSALMKSRNEKKQKVVGVPAPINVVTSPPKTTATSIDDQPYEPVVERMIDHMSIAEIKEIEEIVAKYLYAYEKVPYRNELKYYNDDRPGVQVMEMFGTLIHRYAFYSRMIEDFIRLPFTDQSLLLKGGVLEMCLLRGALAFDPANNHWPNVNMSIYKNAPVLKLGNMSHMTSFKLFQMHMDFIKSVQKLGADEATIMLLILIVLFTPERADLQQTEAIAFAQNRYSALLQRYTNWRYGHVQARIIFSKLLTKLSDLRELSDSHNHHHLHLRREEISSIQHQLESLKLNPYPEMKLFQEDNQAPATDTATTKLDSTPVTSISTPQSEPSSKTGNQQGIQQQQQQQQHWHQQANLQHHQHQQHLQHQQHQQHHQYQQQQLMQQQHQSMEEKMAAQFMSQMQQSISQVVDTPHFGYEWVHPGYHLTQQQLSKSLWALDPSSSEPTLPVEAVQEIPNSEPPLLPRDMQQLYEAIEEYITKTDAPVC